MSNYNENQRVEKNSPQCIHSKGTWLIVIVAAFLLVAALAAYLTDGRETDGQSMKIKNVDIAAMRICVQHPEIGEETMELLIAEDAMIQDVNGQIIDLTELAADDLIQVQFTGETLDGNPAVRGITLLPD
ncbi:MAG: hypothetical protein IJ507_06275, partial [Clostridia bacterium]|nr:hypothetical protein [Clostridia bacterium]